MRFLPIWDPVSSEIFLVDRDLAVVGQCEAVCVRLTAARWLVLRGFGLDNLGNRLNLRDMRVE